jgi:hypothetical protein
MTMMRGTAPPFGLGRICRFQGAALNGSRGSPSVWGDYDEHRMQQRVRVQQRARAQQRLRPRS